MIRILHMDDKRDVSAALNGLLEENFDNAFLKWFDNFEDGITALRESPTLYNGIILDAKCFLSRDDETLDEQYVIKAINEIEQIFRDNSIWMPYCVLSGFKEKLEGYLKANGVVAFDKDDEELSALNHIMSNQKKVYRHLFNDEFPELLEFLNVGSLGKYSASTILQLFGVIKRRQTEPSVIKAQLAQVRPILENILNRLNELGIYGSKPLIPEEFVSISGSRTQVNNIIGSLIYLEGNVANGRNKIDYQRSAVIPSYLSSQAKSIYYVTSEVGNHSSKDTGSFYTLSAMFYSLIDILYWYKEFITNYKKEHTDD